MKSRSYDYLNLKTYPKGAILGLTKRLSSTRFGSRFGENNQEARLGDVVDATGLKFECHHYDSNGMVYLFNKPKKIEAQQTQLGKAWLKDYFFKKDGTPRSGQRTQDVDALVLSISKSVARFEFIGVLGLQNSFGECTHFLPIYRTYNRKGQSFDYAPIHWGKPVIVAVND